MSAHVLLNSLNELRKRDKMRSFQAILDHGTRANIGVIFAFVRLL